jgi:hypothetical protein
MLEGRGHPKEARRLEPPALVVVAGQAVDLIRMTMEKRTA